MYLTIYKYRNTISEKYNFSEISAVMHFLCKICTQYLHINTRTSQYYAQFRQNLAQTVHSTAV